MILRLLRCAAPLLFAALPASAQETVRLANIEWPPYNAERMPEGGAASALIAEAFKSAGVRVEWRFAPFNRAVLLGTTDPSFAGYTTEYWSPEVAERCHLSAPFGRSPVGFVTKIGSDFDWRTVDDLKRWTIGVVDGYVNDGGPFDAAVAAGAIKVDKAPEDVHLVRKVAAGRHAAGVIDANVLAYLASVHKDVGGVVRMHPRLLKEHDLFVCFQRSAHGLRTRTLFDAALATIDRDAFYIAYFTNSL